MVYLALAHQDRRVRGPSPISPTHRGHSSLWQKSWLTLVDYLWIHCGVGNWFRIHTTGKWGSSTAHWKSKCVYTITIHTTSYHITLHVHTRPAGSGVHLPSAPHSCHPPDWDKHWITSNKYLSSLSCVLIWLNRTICWESGVTAVDWEEKRVKYVNIMSK